MKYVKTDVPGYLADKSGHVVINIDEKELLAYKKAVLQASEVKGLREELDGMKALIAQLLER